MTLYYYSTDFDMDGYRTCATPEQTYTFGFLDYVNHQDIHKPFRKWAIPIEIDKETPKGYKDTYGNLYLKKDIDTVLIDSYAGRRINCSLDFYSFRDNVTLEEIKQQFTKMLLDALKHD